MDHRIRELECYRPDYTPHSATQSQSMHKTLQALLIGIAIDEGDIDSIDDPIKRYLPEWRGDPRGEITLRQLLRMTSGLHNFEPGFNPFGDAFRWLYAEDTVSATLAFPQVEPAGSRFDYNDLNAQLLGIILSRATRQRYSDYLAQKLWQPVGNSDAQVWLDREGGNAMHACCLLASTRDWARIGLLIANNGRVGAKQVVDAGWLAKATAPSPLTPHYGYQVWLANNALPNPRKTGYQRSEPFLAEDVVYLSGYGAQRVYISQQRQLVIVRTGPAAGYFPKILKEWDNAWLFNKTVRGIRAPVRD